EQQLIVNPLPTISGVTFNLCEADTNQQESFDLTSQIAALLGASQSPSDFTVNFYDASGAPISPTGYLNQSNPEIITVQGYMNVDFADANTILKDGGVAIMNTGMAEGENRVINALKEALASPLLKCNDVRGAKRILINIYTSTTNEVIIKEIEELKAFLNGINENLEEFIWGATYDDNLEETIKVTIIATGFELDNITGNIKEETKQVETNTESNEKINKMVDEYYGENEQKSEAPPSIIDPFEEDYNKKEEVISLDLWADGEDFDEPAYKRNK
ncbi:MAG TPA: hypothetical protein PK638_03945, partial [Candidatus Enterocola sp.]|nr:hypothetical protein [Candidatus Enterocola sp.]